MRSLKRFLFALATLLLAAGLSAQNVGNAPVTKKTAGDVLNGPLDLSQSTLTFGDNQVPIAKIGGRFSDPIAYLGNLMAEGGTVKFDCRGDSTYWGYLAAGGVQASPTAVQTFQTALRSYYNSSTITCYNNGVSGWGTTDALPGWASAMSASDAQAVVINYGLNDANGSTSPAISAVTYAANLRTLTRIARSAGKIVIFDTSNTQLIYGFIGTAIKPERSKQFASVMRQVAAELNVPVIAIDELFAKLIQAPGDTMLINDDGIHPTQSGYVYRGYAMAGLFIRAQRFSGEGFLSVLDQSVRAYGGTYTTFVNSGSRLGRVLVANKIRIPVWIERDGLDVYIGGPIWTSGTTAAVYSVNGTSIHTQNQAYTFAASYACDHEIMVLRRPRPGFYLIEVNCPGNEDAAVNYLRVRPTLSATQNIYSIAGSVISSTSQWVSFGDITLATSAENTQQNVVLSDVSLPSSIQALSLRFNAKFLGNEGFVVNGLPFYDGSQPGGATIYLSNATGYLNASQFVGAGSFTGNAVIGSTDLRGVDAEWRVILGTNGVISIYVNDALVGTYTPAVSARGGFLGLYANGASKSLRLRNVQIAAGIAPN